MRSKFTPLRIASFVAALFLVLPAGAANRGLFIGTTTFTNEAMGEALPATYDDATDLYNAMVRNKRVSAANARAMTGANTKKEILEAIKKQGAGMGKDDTYIISVSTHGGTDGKFSATDESISADEVAAALKDSGCGTVLFVNDSCYSEKFVLPAIPGKTIAQLNAAAKDQTAGHTSIPLPGRPDASNGLLTRYLVTGLDGAADKNGDGKITMDELREYIEKGYDAEGKKGQGVNRSGTDISLPVTVPDPAHARKYIVPRLFREKSGDAWNTLTTYDLRPLPGKFVYRPLEWLPADWADRVRDQAPAAGTPVAKDSDVTIYTVPDQVVTVPNVITKPFAAGQAAITGAGLQAHVDNPASAGAKVSFQSPGPGTKVTKGSWIVIRKGDKIEVPVIVGKTKAEAIGILKAFKLNPQPADEVPDRKKFPPRQWAGKVWWASHQPKAEVDPNDDIAFKVANATACTVPALGGKTEALARAALAAAGIVNIAVGKPVLMGPSFGVAEGSVVDWQPMDEDIYSTETVTIQMVKYPKVPGIVGKTREQAIALCKAQELVFAPDTEEVPGATDYTRIVRQSPAKDAPANTGSSVTGWLPKPSGEIHITVTDKNTGKLIPKAAISIDGPTRSGSATAAAGTYVIKGVGNGNYRLGARARGYKAKTGGIRVDLKDKKVYRANFKLEPLKPGDYKRIHLFDESGKPTKKVRRGKAFLGKVLPADIPDEAGAIGRVEWFVIPPKSDRMVPMGGAAGAAGLSHRIQTGKKWKTGVYGIIAVITCKDEVIEARGRIKVERNIHKADIGKPTWTGQWAAVAIQDVPEDFLLKGAAGLKIKGAGAFADTKYWKLEGTNVFFRPTDDGQQRPRFVYGYNNEERLNCVGSAKIELTQMAVRIDWDKKEKRDKQDVVPFMLSLPASFHPPFAKVITPEECLILSAPKRKGKAWLFKGFVFLDKLPKETTHVTIDLTDETGAKAQARLGAPGDCVCMHPPDNVLAVIKKFQNKGVMNAIARAMRAAIKKEDDARAKAIAQRLAGEFAVVSFWIADLKECRHISDRIRKLYALIGELMRNVNRGQEPTKADGQRFATAARGVTRADIKPGFMKGVIKKGPRNR
jgi:beta-lactam-binding protein with PASTA domain